MTNKKRLTQEEIDGARVALRDAAVDASVEGAEARHRLKAALDEIARLSGREATTVAAFIAKQGE